MLKEKYIAACIGIISLFSSCGKDKDYDVEGDPEVKFFTNATNSGDAPQNSVSYNLVNIPTAGTSLLNLSSNFPGSIKIPVFATKPVGEDVTIGAELDNSLVTKYNESHGTTYAAFPSGILNTANLSARILKGTTTSVDSVAITPDLTALNVLTEKMYMAPIKLTTVSNKGAGAITGNAEAQIIYVVANMEFRRIKYLAAAADALGSLIANRSTWAATLSPAPSTTGSILDASTTTFTRWLASPAQVDINMQEIKSVTGIRLYTSNSATYIPTQVAVYLSNDGITYDWIGAPLKANLTYASSYNYILFYKAIQAKYIRLVLSYPTSTNTQNYRVTEFDVYAN